MAAYFARAVNSRDAIVRLAGYRALEVSEIDELAAKMDAQQEGRELLKRCAALSAIERPAIELVDLAELTPKEAAVALGVPRGVLRMRLSRARARLRKEHGVDD